MKYPLSCITASDKTEYCYSAQEKLRILHNHFFEWRRKGLSLLEYMNLIPLTVQKKFPYKAIISQEEQSKFIKEEFTPRSEMIQEGILVQRVALKVSTRWNIDVGSIEKFVRA